MYFGPHRTRRVISSEHLNAKEKCDMEQLVSQQLENIESRVSAWDPDEYTLGHIDIAKNAREGTEVDKSEKTVHNEVDEAGIPTEYTRLAV